MLKLCQKLLQVSRRGNAVQHHRLNSDCSPTPLSCLRPQAGPTAEAGPEAEQQREALQLLSINLERRWEAIVMQALQWQVRLKRELGEQQVGALTFTLPLRHAAAAAGSRRRPVTLAERVSLPSDAQTRRERQMAP